MRGIDPRASHMLSERSTTWATPPEGLSYNTYLQSNEAEICYMLYWNGLFHKKVIHFNTVQFYDQV